MPLFNRVGKYIALALVAALVASVVHASDTGFEQTLDDVTSAIYRHDIPRALNLARGVLSRKPEDALLLARAHLLEGWALLISGEHAGALDSLNRSLALDSASAAAYNFRGDCYLQLNQKRKARADYEKALELRPDYAEALNNLGLLLASEENYRGALLEYDKALAIQPNFAEAHFNKALAHLALNDPRSALTDMDQALAIRPQWAEVYYHRALAWRAVGEPGRALGDLNRHLVLHAPSVQTLCWRARVLMDLGRNIEAATDLENALRLDPNHEWAAATLAELVPIPKR